MEVEQTETASAPPARRRQPWLGIGCAVVLLAIGIGWWWHTADPFNPYRDGTTHAATLVYTDPPCLQGWTVTLDDGHYFWQNAQEVPASFGRGPIGGTIHIVHQRVATLGGTHGVAAWFETGGTRLAMVGGREPWISDLTCAVR